MELAERRRRVDSLEHRWLERPGDGTPVVLIHGIPTSPELWRDVIPLLEGGPALAWEMPGYGRSWEVPDGTDISVAAQADRLLAWMRELGLDRAVLVGHDLGGGVAQIAAVRAPERCAGLVLTNSVSYDSWPIPEVKAMRAMAPLFERLPQRLFRAQFSLLIRQGHDDAGRAREAAQVHWRGYDHARGAATLIRQMRSLRTRDTEAVAPALPSLGVPAAVAWGAADRAQKVSYGRRLASDLSTSIDEVDGAKHFLPEDHPDRVAAAVNSVLASAG